MNVQYAAKVRHMRDTEDINAVIMAARIRRERRLRVVMRQQGWFPTPALWTTLDLVHEATRLINNLEDRRESIEDSEAEKAWEMWQR